MAYSKWYKLTRTQELGGWASLTMVLYYAHLSSSHLREAAERIAATNLLHHEQEEVRRVI